MLCNGLQSAEALIPELYSEEVIGVDKRNELQDETKPAEQKRKLVAAVEAQVNQNPKVFYTFLNLLDREEGVMEHLCSQLRSSLGEH